MILSLFFVIRCNNYAKKTLPGMYFRYKIINGLNWESAAEKSDGVSKYLNNIQIFG